MHSIVIGTAGHIDHGKSALVKALTGIDPDRLKEEQTRGITIDLGFAHTVLGDVTVAFVDVPGHERFVRNMLAGAGGIDAVLMVVAADESVMPQTREHFEICRLLALEAGLIAITKSDLVDADTLDVVALEVRELVRGSFLSQAAIVPVSVRTGAGLDELRRELLRLHVARSRQARPGVVRLPIDRVFTVRGFGTVVTGTLVSGEVAEGEMLTVLPGARPVRVRGIQVHGAPAARVAAPSRAALNLGGVDVQDLARGVTLGSEQLLAITRRFDARLELVRTARPLRHGTRVRIHHGTSEISARVAIAAVRDSDTGSWRAVRVGQIAVEIPPGGEAYARLRLERPAVLTRGDRVVLRAYSPATTIGGARVLDPEPPPGGLRQPTTLARFERLDTQREAGITPAEDARDFAEFLLADTGDRGFDLAELVRRGGADPAAASPAVGALVDSSRAVQTGGRIFSASVATDITVKVRDELEAFHRLHPLEEGMSREALRDAVAPASARIFDFAVDSLRAARLVRGAERIALASHRPSTGVADNEAREVILQMTRDAALMPPDTERLRGASRLSQAEFDGLIRLLVRDGELVRIGGLLFHPAALTELRSEIQRLKDDAKPGSAATIDVATFKTRLGLTRKYAIPLLEWMDRERLTRRVGEGRIVL